MLKKALTATGFIVFSATQTYAAPPLRQHWYEIPIDGTVDTGSGASTIRVPPKFERTLISTLFGKNTDLFRCTDDLIITVADAKARADWAYSCNLIDKEVWEYEFTHNYDIVARKPIELPADKRKYPIFVENKEGYPVWHPNYSNCALPDNVVFYDVCMNGCYRGDQRIAFKDGYETIKEAAAKGAKSNQIATLTANSTFDQLEYQLKPIDYFIRSESDSKETLVHLVTKEGQLVVTKDHPVLNKDGYIVMADNLNVGDALVTTKGAAVAIIEKRYEPFFGKVYNVSPLAFEETEHVVVAEGFLNGSHRFQANGLTSFDKVIVKRSIKID